MTARPFASLPRMVHATPVRAAEEQAVAYLARRQLDDGTVVDDPGTLVFQQWDTVNAVNALAVQPSPPRETIERALALLAASEKPSGMLSWGALPTGPGEYCTETSSEYVAALTRCGRRDRALRLASFLAARQLPSGAWEEVHPHIPKAFQVQPSVTGFALQALAGLDLEPRHADAAIAFLAGTQRPEGHFGINWYYYNSHYYLLRPAVAALADAGHHTAVARAREFVLSRQREDGSWESRVEGFEAFSSLEQHTVLALRTLADAGLDARDAAVRRGLRWLIEHQREDGAWDGGFYPYPDTAGYSGFKAGQTVFTTSQVLLLLAQLD